MKSSHPVLAAMAFAAAGALWLLPAQAQVYKCVDASGKTLYLQSPCPAGAKSSTVRTPPPAASAAAPSKPGASPEMEFRKRQQEKAEAEKKTGEQTAEAKTKQENCQRAKQNAAQIQAGGRLSRFTEKGEREYLNDAEIEQEKARARSLLEQWCS